MLYNSSIGLFDPSIMTDLTYYIMDGYVIPGINNKFKVTTCCIRTTRISEYVVVII